jgi:hypothetical protein
MGSADPVWYEDVGVLPRRPRQFWPSADQSPAERVNSLVRLLCYASAALYAYTRRARWPALGLAAAALVSLAYAGPPGGCARGGARGGGPGGGCSRGAAAGGCTRSTPDNPFANALVGDDPRRPAACKYDDHADEIRRNFNRGLVRNAYDVYEKENSQRQWMTNPVTTTIPDTMAFARFCYGGAAGRKTCKEDPAACTGFFP